MRLAAYAGASTALAAGAVLRAFSERPNFYSAAVYLAQSSACRMILANFLVLYYGFFMYGLQRLLFGHLRPIEIEQLWDRGWYTITETALAMTTFRDDVGVWFFVMFVSLLTGKVWGWISQGRVEVLEQQPPANPRMFHARLVTSLVLSVLFDIFFLRYCIYTLLDQPRPGMMVMFAFEFALLLISSTSTVVRYGLSVQEILVVKKQTKQRVEERRQEIRAAQSATTDGQQTGETTSRTNQNAEDDIDENEIDVPGWQEKGGWVLFLDLMTDFLKLLVYIGFFSFLILFHGLPIHIIRDLYITTTSFIRRIRDYVRYRNATRDMNQRYEDATAEDLQRDGTCIVCREDMSPWQQPEAQPQPAQGQRPAQLDERHRPKKLPCGHILHLGCLRSWLERQQVCPTCRRSVMEPPNGQSNNGSHDRPAPPGNAQRPQRPDNNNNNQNVNNQHQGPNQRHGHDANNNNINNNNQANNLRARTWNLGSMRITFAAGNRQEVQEALRQAPDVPNTAEPEGAANRQSQRSASRSNQQLEGLVDNLIHRLANEVSTLQSAQEELNLIRAVQYEIARLRHQRSLAATDPAVMNNTQPPITPLGYTQNSAQTLLQPQQGAANSSTSQDTQHQTSQTLPSVAPVHSNLNAIPQQLQSLRPQHPQFMGNDRNNALPAGDPNLPAGVAIPEGWSLLPLQRIYPADTSNSAPLDRSNFAVVRQQLPQGTNEFGTTSPAVNPTESNAVAPQPQSQSSEQQPVLGALNTTVSSTGTDAPASNTRDDESTSRTASPAAPTPIRQVGRQSSNSSLNLPNWSSQIPIATSRRRSPTPEPTRTPSAAGSRFSWPGTRSPVTAESQQSSKEEGNSFGVESREKGKAKAATVEDDVDANDTQ